MIYRFANDRRHSEEIGGNIEAVNLIIRPVTVDGTLPDGTGQICQLTLSLPDHFQYLLDTSIISAVISNGCNSLHEYYLYSCQYVHARYYLYIRLEVSA